MNKPKYPETLILSVAKTTLTHAEDNVLELSTMGITTEKLGIMRQDIQTAEATPSNLTQIVAGKSRTSAKNESLKGCNDWGRRLTQRMENAFGPKSAEMAAFPRKAFRAAAGSEDKMMSVMETLLGIAQKYQTRLAPEGQTAAELELGQNLLQQLRAADAVQETGKGTKKTTTKQRDQIYNKLYNTVNKINKTGRLVFKDDPVKRVLFESPWPPSPGKDKPGETPPEA